MRRMEDTIDLLFTNEGETAALSATDAAPVTEALSPEYVEFSLDVDAATRDGNVEVAILAAAMLSA